MIKVASDFSGVGAFNQALNRLGIEYKEVFACDMDKYARDTFILNYGEPGYYPTNVYDREIPKQSLDIYMTSPPCQAFSLAGKRLGKDDKRGILFFNSHEFIKENNPRYFIFENVKGLLSDDNGRTFQEWISLLGGKSVNGNPVLFAHEDAVTYHIYWKVLNAKNFGVPQNRERVFIIGIRDDQDNTFRFPIEFTLTKRLKDILEDDVDNKYFLSEKMINGFLAHNKRHIEEKNQDGFNWKPKNENNIANCLRANAALCPTDNTLKIKSATSKGYEIATEGDSINLSVPSSETRRGRVGKGVAQTLDTGCQQAVFDNYKIRRLTPRECFRLMDFPDSFKWNVSDSQAYKQAGNSIVVNVLYLILKNLNFENTNN
jgi:DNA (cytosine-5)-methyltransferase 1